MHTAHRNLLRRFASTPHWVETKVGDLVGVRVVGPSPGIIWVHGLGGSCAADTARGIGSILNPAVLGRSVLRLDMRGHGRSCAAHDESCGDSQYLWDELAKELRVTSRNSLSRAFFGGEAMGAAVALRAAVAATATGSVDAPPGLVLMRPPLALANAAASRSSPAEWKDKLQTAAATVEKDGYDDLEKFEDSNGMSLVDGAHAIYCDEDRVAALSLLKESRRSMPAPAFAAALRAHASSNFGGQDLKSLGKERHAMADDAYGVPMTLRCPVLVLAVPGDPEHPVEAAEELASILPGAELTVAKDLQNAHDTWAKRIDEFLRKAWMKEFLTKRVMPQ